MDMLPEELLVEVLKYLSQVDRLTCATTSKRLAEALTRPELLKDIWFTVRGDEMGRAAPALIKSCREYQNLRLSKVDLNEFDSEFWGKAGKTLRRLELNQCRWTPQVLYDILRKCTSVTHLRIYHMDARDIPPENHGTCGTSVEDVRASLRNAKHLHLSTHSVDVVVHLLGLIPNTSSISLKVFEEEFPWETLIRRTSANPRIVTELDLYNSAPSDADLILIMRAFSGTLRELRLNCRLLSSRAGAAIAECSRLRHLSLMSFHELENAHMTTILRSNPSLEMLDLAFCDSLKDEGLSPIYELTKLRRLEIFRCNAITNEFLCRMGEILTLEYLASNCTRPEFIQSVACLKNLEGLRVGSYIQSPESLRLICMNLEKLQTLNLGDCQNLSDANGLMLSCLRRLRTLTVINAFGFKDLTLEGVIWGSEMESLTVSTSSLTDLGLLNLVGQHGRLKFIHLRRCENITDQGLMTVLPRAPLLKAVRLAFCRSVGDEFIEALGDSCPRLEYVNVSACAISCCAIESFRKRRPAVNVYFEPQYFD